MQFFMGLTEGYDEVRSHILVLDPLPTMSKAFLIVLCIEKLRFVQSDMVGITKGRAMAVQTSQYGSNSRNNSSKRNQKNDDRTCEHCKIKGHMKEVCFKLHGYPDWYKELKKGKTGGKAFANTSKCTEDS